MKVYNISLDGCDDSTGIEMTLTDAQADFVKILCAKFNEASTYGCMPRMSIAEQAQNQESK